MLYHHSGRPYQEAASEAATQCRAKLEGLIENGRTRATAVIEKVQAEVPTDKIVKSGVVNFARRGGLNDRLTMGWNGEAPVTVHRHALHQLAERASIPFRFVDDLQSNKETWGIDLLAHNLNEIIRRQDRRMLVRAVDGEARGVLSSKFRRLDNRPILDAFCKASQECGLVPVEGYALDTQISLKALIPTVFEPVPHEIVAFGLKFGNSDFGDGALSVRVFMLRLWCTNYAITDEALRQVHLGRDLGDSFEFSQETYALDTKRSSSMVRDVVRAELSPERVEEALGLIRKANDENVTAGHIAAFLKRNVQKSDAESITEAYNSADVVNLPPGNTSWRFSNAISWVAGKQENEYKKLDLMKIAALALPKGGALHNN